MVGGVYLPLPNAGEGGPSGPGEGILYTCPVASSKLPSLVKEGARGWSSWFSLPKHKTQIENIQARLWDLLPLIRNNIYHPNFRGSFSIKSVLPALIPEMSYEGMLIADGEQAGLAWEELVRGNIPKAEKKRLRDGLVAYCRQDTLAMVELLARIRQT